MNECRSLADVHADLGARRSWKLVASTRFGPGCSGARATSAGSPGRARPECRARASRGRAGAVASAVGARAARATAARSAAATPAHRADAVRRGPGTGHLDDDLLRDVPPLRSRDRRHQAKAHHRPYPRESSPPSSFTPAQASPAPRAAAGCRGLLPLDRWRQAARPHRSRRERRRRGRRPATGLDVPPCACPPPPLPAPGCATDVIRVVLEEHQPRQRPRRAHGHYGASQGPRRAGHGAHAPSILSAPSHWRHRLVTRKVVTFW